MWITRSANLPNLDTKDERGLFTFARLLNPSQISITMASDLVFGINQYIFETWGVQLTSSSIGLCWSDHTGDFFQLRDDVTI